MFGNVEDNMVTNKELLKEYVKILENLLESQESDSEKLQELSIDLGNALDLQDLSDEELGNDLWFQDHVLKELE